MDYFLTLLKLKNISKMPMEKTFTRFLSYSDISVNEIDLLEDAFFSDIDYGTFMDFIGELVFEPSQETVMKLLKKI